MDSFRLLTCIADSYERKGLLGEAWAALAEIAHSAPKHHPIHDRLLALEFRMQQADSEAAPNQDAPPAPPQRYPKPTV